MVSVTIKGYLSCILPKFEDLIKSHYFRFWMLLNSLREILKGSVQMWKLNLCPGGRSDTKSSMCGARPSAKTTFLVMATWVPLLLIYCLLLLLRWKSHGERICRWSLADTTWFRVVRTSDGPFLPSNGRKIAWSLPLIIPFLDSRWMFDFPG